MSENRLKEIQKFGQSIWYDNIQKGMISSGAFQQMIAQDGLCGVTSNPTIFDKAVSKSADYDQDIARDVAKGLDSEAIYWNLVVQDIQDAANIFLPVYQGSGGTDGFISIEVSPLLAHDTEGTLQQARELFRRVNRINVMIKVPATPAGIPVIRKLISEGIHVNATLIFSIQRYREVMDAYLSGLEDMAGQNGSITGTASVASFFVSRVDVLVDQMLEEKIKSTENESEKEALRQLLGKIAIAHSKTAYREFKKIFSSERFLSLKTKGAQLQRPLWASTSTKNPDYRDVMYVESLMGPDSVNTLPPATLDAFRDHGAPGSTIEDGWEEVQTQLGALAAHGIDLDTVTQTLEDQGVQAFADSFQQLLRHLNEKRESLTVQQ